MPNIYYNGCRIYFWINENNEPIHVHISDGPVSKDGFKVWINKDGSYTIDEHNQVYIKKSILDKGLDFIKANSLYIKQKWADFYHISLENIKYKE